jgi:hypothetical protein
MRIFERDERAAGSLAELLPDIEERLFARTPPAIRKAASREASPPWCCALMFDGSLSKCLPPVLSLSTLAEREETLRKWGADGRTLIWRCAAFDGINAAYYEDAKLEAACDEANELLRRRTTTLPARKLLLRLAKRLNALPRKAFGKVAEEFVVYACDLNEPEKALVNKSLTAVQRALLKRMRLR